MTDDLASWHDAILVLRLRAVMRLERVGGRIAWPDECEIVPLWALLCAGRAG